MKEVAILGSPNCGKTTIFNRLTGTRQRTGNWPGVTVERKDGRMSVGDERVNIVDLPGVYSLETDIQGLDAEVVHRYLNEEKPALVILVLDATRLPRQLSLLPQLLASGVPILLTVNMLDSAEENGIGIDLAALSREAGLPVSGVVGSTGRGIEGLKEQITNLLKAYPALPESVNIEKVAASAYQQGHALTRTEKIDSWLLHPWLALPFFLLVMYLLFTVSVNVGSVFIDFFDLVLGSWVVETPKWLLASIGAPEWLQVMIADGLGGGIQLVGTFIPVIGCLYLCMSVLEDSGYLSRAAFVIDRVMARIGLPGQAFIPLIIGFGCNVPSVMAARSLNQMSARLTTVFIAPFMSCGARLSVYVFIGTAFFPRHAHNAIFALYFLGILVAVLSAWVLRRKIFNEAQAASITEMPAYHRPLLRNVLTQTWHRLYSFVWRAGKSIVSVVFVLSIVSSLGTDGTWGNQNTEKSVLSEVGKSITPVFEPIGVGEENWPATVGLFTGLFAKEVVVGTLDNLYAPPQLEQVDVGMPDYVGDFAAALTSVVENGSGLVGALVDPLGIGSAQDELQGQQPESYASMLALFPSAWGAFCYLVFILLYAPCVATIGVMLRESNKAWLGFSVVWSLVLSYWVALVLWQLSLVVVSPLSALMWIALSSLLVVLLFQFILARMQQNFREQIPLVNV